MTGDSVGSDYQSDYGRVVCEAPARVVRPTTREQVGEAVAEAARSHSPVAARGTGHTTGGHSLSPGGTVIDLTAIAPAIELEPDGSAVRVGAGVTWAQVIDATLPHGLAPQVTTDFLHLSVGGTISVGGLAGSSHRHGAISDKVSELEVVVGSGERVRCDRVTEPELFAVVPAGLGVYGIITEAVVELVRVPEEIVFSLLTYGDRPSLLKDIRALSDTGGPDFLDGTFAPVEGSSERREIWCVHSEKNAEEFGVALNAERVVTAKLAIRDFLYRVEDYVAELRQMGMWAGAHPWIDMFVPAHEAGTLADMAMDTIERQADGLVMTYAVNRSRIGLPMLALPQTEEIVLVDVLRNVPVDDRVRQQRLLAENRRLMEYAFEVGGTIYPVGAPAPDAELWRRQYGPLLERARAAKRRYDPDGVFRPGHGLAEVLLGD